MPYLQASFKAQGSFPTVVFRFNPILSISGLIRENDLKIFCFLRSMAVLQARIPSIFVTDSQASEKKLHSPSGR